MTFLRMRVGFLRPRWPKGPSTSRLVGIAIGMLCWVGYSWLHQGPALERIFTSGISAWWTTILFGGFLAILDRTLKSRAVKLDKFAAIALLIIVVVSIFQVGASSQFVWTVELIRERQLPDVFEMLGFMFLYFGSVGMTPTLFWYEEPNRPTAA